MLIKFLEAGAYMDHASKPIINVSAGEVLDVTDRLAKLLLDAGKGVDPSSVPPPVVASLPVEVEVPEMPIKLETKPVSKKRKKKPNA